MALPKLVRVTVLVPWVQLACGAGSSDGDDETGASSESSSSGDGASTTITTATGTASTSASGSASTTTGEPPADTTAADTDGDDESSTTDTPAGCDIDPLAPDTYVDLQLEHDGVMRSYNLYVPIDFTGDEPLPLVFDIHGLTGSPTQQQTLSMFDATADSYGLAVVYPAGLGNSWNAGACCGSSATTGVDDVGFVLAVLADVQTRLCIDPKRVYATGMSNGGFLSHRLACEAADSFAAIAPVAGVLGIPFESCTPSRAVPVIQFHGTSDLLVPYNGNALINYPSVADTMAQWVGHDGCTGEPASTFMMDDAHCEAWETCDGDARVELCTVEGGGHCWPGNPSCLLGSSTTAISASDRMAEFFLGYALP